MCTYAIIDSISDTNRIPTNQRVEMIVSDTVVGAMVSFACVISNFCVRYLDVKGEKHGKICNGIRCGHHKQPMYFI